MIFQLVLQGPNDENENQRNHSSLELLKVATLMCWCWYIITTCHEIRHKSFPIWFHHLWFVIDYSMMVCTFIYVCYFLFKLTFARGFYCKQRKYLRKIQIQLIRICTFLLILMLGFNNAMLDFQLLEGIRIFSPIDSCFVELLYYFRFFCRQFSIQIIAWEKRPARVQKTHKQNTIERKNCYFAQFKNANKFN